MPFLSNSRRFFLRIILVGLVAISSSLTQDSKKSTQGLKATTDVEVDRTRSPRSLSLDAVQNVGKLILNVQSMINVEYAATISLTNNHHLDLTDPQWYLVDGNFDTPPPDILKNKQTIIITYQGAQGIKSMHGTKGFLTYKMGNSFLVVFWFSMPAYSNRLLVKIVNQDPNPVIRANTQKLYEEYYKDAWIFDDYGKWNVGTNKDIKCKLVASMGNGRKAPVEIFLTPAV